MPAPDGSVSRRAAGRAPPLLGRFGAVDAALAALVLLAAALVLRYGVLSAHETRDLASPWAQSVAWLAGHDPYNGAVVGQALPSPMAEDEGLLLPIYPPSALPLFAPFALLPLPLAAALYKAAAFVLALAAIAALAFWADLGHDRRVLVFAAVALSFMSVRNGLWLGQPSAIAIPLAILGCFALARDRALAGGLLIALAAAVKPQIGAPFFVYLLAQRRWAALGTAVAVGLVLFAAGVLPLVAEGHFAASMGEWRDAFRAPSLDVRAAAVPDDPRLNLDMILTPLLGSARSHLWSAVLLLVPFLLWARAAATERAPDAQLLVASALGVLLLLPVYHRPYDAELLLLPWAWVMAGSGLRLHRAAATVLILPFVLVSWPSELTVAAASGRIPASILASWWWQPVVLAYQAWLLLALAAVLLLAVARGGRMATSDRHG